MQFYQNGKNRISVEATGELPKAFFVILIEIMLLRCKDFAMATSGNKN